MFGFFKSDPQKKIKKQIEKKYAQSVQLQRSGKLEEYGKCGIWDILTTTGAKNPRKISPTLQVDSSSLG